MSFKNKTAVITGAGSGKISGKGNEINYQDSHRIWNLPETI